MKNPFKKAEPQDAELLEGVETAAPEAQTEAQQAEEKTVDPSVLLLEENQQLKQRIVVLESEKAQLLALPPELRKKEDPSPTTESRCSTNQSAYDADAAGFLNK